MKNFFELEKARQSLQGPDWWRIMLITTFTRVKIARYVSEFSGTFFLIFFIKMSAGLSVQHSEFAIGFCLMIMVYKYGYISGGHYNPAVTIAVLARGGLETFPINDYGQIVMYIFSQLFGGMVGGLTALLIGGHETCVVVTRKNLDYTYVQGFFAEFFGTFFLTTTVLHVGTHQLGNEFYGLAIGCSLLVCAISIAGITGCAINPAVWFGTVVSSVACQHINAEIKEVWMYWLAEFTAGLAAGLSFRALYMAMDQPETDVQQRLEFENRVAAISTTNDPYNLNAGNSDIPN